MIVFSAMRDLADGLTRGLSPVPDRAPGHHGPRHQPDPGEARHAAAKLHCRHVGRQESPLAAKLPRALPALAGFGGHCRLREGGRGLSNFPKSLGTIPRLPR